MGDKKKILVVDDEQDICTLVKDGLEATGIFEVTTITDSTVAERTVRETKPDLVLLDVVMPRVKGSDIARVLKTDPATAAIPIIIMSGLGEMVYFKRKDKWQWMPTSQIVLERGEVVKESTHTKTAAAYGVDDYLEKPFNIETLATVVKEVLKME